ncbi:MAG: 2-oxoglutarate ferredoxin oxidoreductase subunit alpha, partial [Acidobacteria bacterium]|nr:2-oxoglutarate ferredoxin oxidoreductase subunit alpha [Acidobacteriota bacterium]
ATKFLTPVILLSDGYIANSSEPWLLPDVDTLPEFPVTFATEPNEGDAFLPYVRDEETLARPWAVPGTPGLQHRIGGLEKKNRTGNVDYVAENHALMTELRARKIDAIARDIPPQEIYGDTEARLLVLGWGSTFGAIRAATMRTRDDGLEVAHAQLKYLNPFPPNLAEVLDGRDKILIPELNSGHLAKLIRAEFLVEIESFGKVEGDPFKAVEIEDKIRLLRKEISS